MYVLPIPRVGEFPGSERGREREAIFNKPRAARRESQTRPGRAAQLVDAPGLVPPVSTLQSARTERDHVTNTQDAHRVSVRRVQAARAFKEPATIVNQED